MDVNSADELEIDSVDGGNMVIYTLYMDDMYHIPSDNYHSGKDSTPVSLKTPQFGPIIFLVNTEKSPANLIITTKNSDSDLLTQSEIVIVCSVIGAALLCLGLIVVFLVYLYRKRAPRPSSVEQATILQNSALDHQLSEKLEEFFPVRRYVAIADPISVVCAICQEDFTKASEVRTLPCKHTYHSACMEQAFSVTWKCVVCGKTHEDGRTQVRLTEKQSQP